MALLSLFFIGNSKGTSYEKRHYVPEMRTRTKMKNVASDCARRENVPRHILFYIYTFL